MTNEPAVPYLRRRRIEGLVALVFVQLCFGVFPVFVKIAADPGAGDSGARLGVGFEPRAIAFWRILIGALVLTSLAAAGQRGSFRVSKQDLGRLALCSILGVVANQWLALEGVVLTHAITAGILMTLIPVFTYGVAILARQELASRRRSAGIALALSGALGLLLSQAGDVASEAAARPVLGGLLIVLNCLSYAGYLVVARSLLLRLPPLVVVAWTFLFALLFLPLLAQGVEVLPSNPAPRALWALGGLLLFTTVIGYALNAWALARVSASTAAVFVYMQPVIAGTGAMLVLGERPGLATFVAALVLFAGIWLVVGKRSPARAG